jgi:dipeptidyl aminopeptidase/acylaminoacyl peptidase
MPNIQEDRHGWPAQPRPDRRLPPPWTAGLLTGWNHVHHHALSPDGQQVAFIWQREGHNDLYVLDVDGAAWPRRLTFDRPATAWWSDEAPRWSPDSRTLVFSAHDDLWRVDVATGQQRRLTDFKQGDSSPIFSPDGQRIYFLNGRGDFENLCRTTPDGAWPVALTREQADAGDPQPSPDGQQVAFVFHPQDDLNRSEIRVVPAGGGPAQALTGAAQVQDYHPRWSPDGRQIAFISTRSGWRALHLLDAADGSVRQLSQHGTDVQGFAWRPDGCRVALVLDRDGAGDLYLLDVATGETKLLRGGDGWHSLPHWSPDGQWLTVEFESPTQPPDIYRVSAASGEARALTHSMPPALAAAGLLQPQFVRYPSSRGASIPALLFRPPAASPHAPCPAIVYPHGGPTDEYARTWDVLTQWLLAKGYAVLAPNYRGSTGYGLEHQRALHGAWGIVDCDDMLAAADTLAGLDWVDGGRLGIYGASYGSYLALLALARDPHTPRRYRCGVAKFGDCDILGSWAQGDRVGREDLERQMGHPSANRAGYRAGSPVYDVGNMEAPLLILHGEEDRRVHPKQSQQLVEALRRAGKTFEYVVYGGEGHGFVQAATLQHFYATLERFLDWYLL